MENRLHVPARADAFRSRSSSLGLFISEALAACSPGLRTSAAHEGRLAFKPGCGVRAWEERRCRRVALVLGDPGFPGVWGQGRETPHPGGAGCPIPTRHQTHEVLNKHWLVL